MLFSNERLVNMKLLKIVFAAGILIGITTASYALEGVLATAEDVLRLKEDVLAGKIKVGITRLKEISRNYGDAASITDTQKKFTYEYQDLKIEFDKKKYLRNWEYDSFKTPAYTDDIDDLRSDLESKEIVGDYVTFSLIKNDYGEPTEYKETNRDGEHSVYYYGNIKLAFENVIVVKQWRGKNLATNNEFKSIASSNADKKSELISSGSNKPSGSVLK